MADHVPIPNWFDRTGIPVRGSTCRSGSPRGSQESQLVVVHTQRLPVGFPSESQCGRRLHSSRSTTTDVLLVDPGTSEFSDSPSHGCGICTVECRRISVS